MNYCKLTKISGGLWRRTDAKSKSYAAQRTRWLASRRYLFKESFKNAGTSLITINGVYDLEGSLQLLLERDKSRAKELDEIKKQLVEAKNAKPPEGGDHERPKKWW